MDNRYLVLTGNEYGVNILDNINLEFKNLQESEELYDEYIEEYNCAVMFELVKENEVLKLKEVKSYAQF